MEIYGYLFQITVEEGDEGFIAYAPGVGGVYEEGETEDEAISNAYEAACAILETRLEENDPVIEDSPYIKVLTSVPRLQDIVRGKTIPNGYIATPHCNIPAAA